jgi:hypothetical protein
MPNRAIIRVQVVYAEKESNSQDSDSGLGLHWVKEAEQEIEVPEHQLK